MEYQENEITVLKNSEFMLLLAAAGMDRWYGIEIGSPEELDSDRAFNRNLAGLYQKNFIDWSSDRAYMTGSCRRIFEVLRSSTVCVTVSSAGRPDYVRGCYFSGGDVATVDRRTAAPDEVELSVMEWSVWLKELEEDGSIPETAGVPEKNEKPDMEKELVSRFELRSIPEGDLLETAEIFYKGLYGLLERTGGKKTETEYFTKEKFTGMLKDWIGGSV